MLSSLRGQKDTEHASEKKKEKKTVDIYNTREY